MNILHIVPSYKPAYIYGGPIISISCLCENQTAIGHGVTVYTTTANGKEELDIETGSPIEVDGVSVYYFERVTKDHTSFSPALLRKLWKTIDQFDVIHIHSWWNVLVIMATAVCYLKGIKPVLSPRGMLTQYTFLKQHSLPKKIIHASIGKYLLKKTILHATTELELEETKRLYPRWPSFILPNIVTFPTYKEKNAGDNTDMDVFKIIFLSRIDPKKGLELLFKALARVTFNYELMIAGEGNSIYTESLRQLATQLGIDDKISWIGWQNGEKKYELLNEADLFVLSSYNENFANAVLEALSTGTSVLISNQVGLFSYVKENNFGWVCELTLENIRENLELAFESVLERERIRNSSPLQVREDFSGKKVAKKYVSCYQALL